MSPGHSGLTFLAHPLLVERMQEKGKHNREVSLRIGHVRKGRLSRKGKKCFNMK
jgi:hypothetical protein